MAVADMADNADHNLHIDGFPVNGMSMLLHSSVYVLCCMVRAVTWSKDIVNCCFPPLFSVCHSRLQNSICAAPSVEGQIELITPSGGV